MKHREDIYSTFVNKTGLGVEVGVQNGFNLKKICDAYHGQVFGVDVWFDKEALVNASINAKEKDAILLVGKSESIAKMFADNSLDFVYIDADHHYEEVKKDFNAWYPKVRPGGIVCGHDYGLNDCIGVKEFIDELMKTGQKVEFTTDDFWNNSEYQSWFFTK